MAAAISAGGFALNMGLGGVVIIMLAGQGRGVRHVGVFGLVRAVVGVIFVRIRSRVFVVMLMIGVIMLTIVPGMIIMIVITVLVIMMCGFHHVRSVSAGLARGISRVIAGKFARWLFVVCDQTLAGDPFRGTLRAAVARSSASAGPPINLGLGIAMRAFFFRDQRLPICDWDLIIVRMNFAEGQKAVAIAAVVDERSLQGRFYPRDFGEIDVAAKLAAAGGFEVEFLNPVAA